MKKVLKSFAALMLALALTITCTPTTVHAAAALRDYAQFGDSYKVYTVLPGKIKVYANVTVTDVNTYYYSTRGYYNSSVTMQVNMPKSQQKKIQKNVSRILNACPVTKRTSYMRYHRSFYTFCGTAITGDTHMPLTLANTGNQAGIYYGYFTPTSSKYFRQGNNRLSINTSYRYSFDVQYTPQMQGNILLGVCGMKKPTFDNNSAVKGFNNGYNALEGTNLYNSKSGNNSIWVRF